jgi:hypothetical protein
VEWLALPLSLSMPTCPNISGTALSTGVSRTDAALQAPPRRQHHRFFNHQAMPIDNLRDLRVLFRPCW